MFLLDQSWLTLTLSHSNVPRLTVHQDMSSQPDIADYYRKSHHPSQGFLTSSEHIYLQEL